MPLFADVPVVDDDETLSAPDLAKLLGLPKPPPYRAGRPAEPDISQLLGPVPDEAPPYRAPIDQTPDLAMPDELGPIEFTSPSAAPPYRAMRRHASAPPPPQKPAIEDLPMTALASLPSPDGTRTTPPMTPDQEYQRYLTGFEIDSATRKAPAGKQYVPLSRPEFDQAKSVADLQTSTLRSGYRALQQKAPTELGGGGGMKPPVASSGSPGIGTRAMQALGLNLRAMQNVTEAPRAGAEQIFHGVDQMNEPGAAEKLRGAGKIVAGAANAASPALLALGVSAPIEAAAWWIVSKNIAEATPAIAKHFGANEEDAQEITDVAQSLPLLYGIGKIGVRRAGEARATTAAEAAQRFDDAAQQREQTAIASGVDPFGFQPVDVTLNSPNGPVRGQVREIKAGSGNRKPVYQIVEENGKGWRIGDADTITNYLRRDAADQGWIEKLQQSAPGEFAIGEAPRIETPVQAQAIEQAKTFQGAAPSPALETNAEAFNKFLFNEGPEGLTEEEGSSPDEPPAPEPPAQVDRVSDQTPNAPTAATPTTAESQDTQVIQLQQLTDGTRKVVMFPKGSTPPSYPPGTSVTHDPFGNIYVYRPDLIKATDIHAAAKNNTLPEILGSATLGMGAPDKSGIPGEPTHTVVARDGNGTEVQATATTAEDLPATIEATHHVTPPGGSVSVEPVEKVLAEREGAQPAASATPTEELGKPADLERKPEDTTGLTQLGGDMAGGIVAGMRDMLWQRAQEGKTTEGGQPSAVLQAAKLIRDRGGLQTPEEFHKFLGDYGNVKRDGDFQQSMRDLVGKYTPQAKATIDQIAAGLKALVDSKDPIDPEARKNLLVQALDLHSDGFNGAPLTPEEVAYWEKKITPVRDRLAKKAEKEAAQARAKARQAPVEDDRAPVVPQSAPVAPEPAPVEENPAPVSAPVERTPWYRKEEPDWWPEIQAQMGERPPSWKQVVDAWESRGKGQVLKEYAMDWADNTGPAHFARREYEESLTGSSTPEQIEAPADLETSAPEPETPEANLVAAQPKPTHLKPGQFLREAIDEIAEEFRQHLDEGPDADRGERKRIVNRALDLRMKPKEQRTDYKDTTIPAEDLAYWEGKLRPLFDELHKSVSAGFQPKRITPETKASEISPAEFATHRPEQAHRLPKHFTESLLGNPQDWTAENLQELSKKKLDSLLTMHGLGTSGTKAQQVGRLIENRDLQAKYDGKTAEDLAALSGKEIDALLDQVGVGKYGAKPIRAATFLNELAKRRAKGLAAIARWNHQLAVERESGAEPVADLEDLAAPAEVEVEVEAKAEGQIPNKVAPAPVGAPVTYFTGTHNAGVVEAARRRKDIGLLFSPLRPDLINKVHEFPVVAVDNGAFSQATPFSEENFTKLVDKIAERPEVAEKVRFIVAPDVPFDAAGTVKIFDRWADYIHSKGLPVAFAAQNGIEFTPDQIPWDKMDVLFIGGDTAWKTGTHLEKDGRLHYGPEAKAWYDLWRTAKAKGIPIHMGRVNSGSRLDLAEQGLGASSVDGNFLKHGPDINLPQLEKWLDNQNTHGRQNLLPGERSETGDRNPAQPDEDDWERERKRQERKRNAEAKDDLGTPGLFGTEERRALDEALTDYVADKLDKGKKVEAGDTVQFEQDGAILGIEQRHIDAAKRLLAEDEARRDGIRKLQQEREESATPSDLGTPAEVETPEVKAQPETEETEKTEPELPKPGQFPALGQEDDHFLKPMSVFGNPTLFIDTGSYGLADLVEQGGAGFGLDPQGWTTEEALGDDRKGVTVYLDTDGLIGKLMPGVNPEQYAKGVAQFALRNNKSGDVRKNVLGFTFSRNYVQTQDGKVSRARYDTLLVRQKGWSLKKNDDGSFTFLRPGASVPVPAEAPETDDDLGTPASIEQPIKQQTAPTPEPEQSSEQPEQSEELATPQALEPGGATALVNAVYEKLRRGESLGNVTELTRLAEQHFGSGRTDGEWSVKDMFDAMEAGINKYQLLIGKDLMELPFEEGIQVVRNLMARITSQGTRTDEQVKRQQFSTPPSQAYLAVTVANVKPSDVVMDTSAGNGGLVVLPKAMGATVHVNEIAPRRIEMLEAAGFGKATNHDGETIHSSLDRKIRPTVIIMNPPFSTSTRQGDTRNRNIYGFNHVTSALQRLEPGGRLVVILGGGQANEPNGGASLFGGQSGKWFEKVARNYTIRANVRIAGKEYQKYGTTFATRLIVIDKTGPTTDMSTVVQGNTDTLEQAYELLRPVAESRPELQARPGSPASTGQQSGSRGGLAPGANGVPSGGGRTTAGGTSSNAQSDTGSEPVGTDGSTAGNAPRPGSQSPTRVEPDAGLTNAGAGESPDSAKSATSDDNDERPVQPPELTERQELESVDRGEDPDQEDTQAYVTYRPTLKGASHPGEIVETKAMATVPMPKITYKPALPKDVIEKKVSAVQLEGISLAGQQNEIVLPSGARSSVLIGDGTGVGKGREAAGILLDNWLQGRRRLVWVSKNWNLTQDAMRDLDGLGATDLMRGITRENGRYIVDKKGGQPRFVQQGDFDAGASLKAHKGLVFTTYTLLPTGDKKNNTRLGQLEQYLRGDDDGEGAFILFDESHLLKNAVTTGRAQASQVGMGIRQILDRIPKLRTASLSATAATDVTNLGYLGRLGLWGAGTAFPSGFEQFQSEMAEGGLAAMELVARELKAQGKYLSRTLSFKGVTYETTTHKLTPDQRVAYKTASMAWDTALKAAMATIEGTTNGGGRARSAFLSQLGGAQQRFFSVLLTTLKIPTAVEIAKKAEKDGFSVAISLVNTNEASQNRMKAKLGSRTTSEDEDEQELDFGPKEILTNLIRQHYPIHQYADGVDLNGQPTKVLVMKTNPADPTGPQIAEVNPQAEAERDALVAQIERDLHLPENPLDSLIKALGGRGKVAELTGRTEIYDRSKRSFIPRGDKGVPKDQINIIEMAKFQDGEKNFAVLSSAADTGISLHASNQAKNQRRRMMITLQVGWSADKAQQMLGRVHRTDQASAPHYVLLVSDMGGEMRFISTIARRIASLGALTKGQKDATGGNDLMAQVDFQGEQGIAATVAFYEALLKDQQVPGTRLKGREILSKLRVLRDGMTVSGNDRTNVNKLLNGLLALEPDIQNQVYKYYFEIFQAAIQEALENNTLDTGVRNLPGDEFFFGNGRTIATDPKTGATTHYQPVTVRSRIPRLSLKQREQRMRTNAASNPRVVVSSDGKKMALLTDAYPIVHTDGSQSPAVFAARPERNTSNRTDASDYEKWRTPEDFAQQKQAMLETKVKELEGALARREKMLADAEASEKERRRRPIASRIQSLESRIQSVDQALEREDGNDASVREYYATARQQAQDSLAQAQKDLAEVENYKHEDQWLTRDIESIRKNLDTAKAALEPWKELFEDPETWGDELWERLHDAAPAHEDIEHHFITGAVFNYWNAIRKATYVRNSIYTASDSSSQKRIVGIEIPDGAIKGLLGRIEGGGSTVDATQMIIDVLRSDLQYELEAGIQVVRGRVARENVIELITTNPDVARRLTALGAVYERGVMARYYIPNKNTHQILSAILAEYPILANTPPPANGGGGNNSVTLGSGLGALQALPQYFTPQLKAASRFFSRVTDDAKRVFAPQTRGEKARESAGTVREMMGTLAQKEAQVHAALEEYRKVFRQLPEEHGIHGLAVIDAIEGGPQAIAALPTELQGFATTVRDMYEGRKQLLDGLGLVKHFLENYFTHMYKNPAEAEAWTANWLSKRPLAGKEEFRKQRVYPTLREALEDPDFTLVAKFDNPVDYVYAGLAQMDKSIAAHELFNEWNDAGYLKYSLKRPDAGYTQIDDKMFTVRGPRRGAVKIDPLEPQQRAGEDIDEFEARYRAWEDKVEAIEGGYIKPGDVSVYGQRTMGHYWAPDQIAQVANNYLSPGMQGKAFYDAWMKAKGHMNAINLGFSGFHALTTTLNSSLSDMALGTQQVLSGKPVKGLVSIGKGFVPFQSIAQDYLRGSRLGKVWDGTAANPTAQELAIVDAIRQAGGRYQQSGEVAPLLEGMKQAWAKNKVSGIIRGFNPWLWAEQSMRPIMEKLVPAAKFGAFAKLAQFEMERDPGMDPNEARRRFGSILDSIDNRMGQLSQRNMLMDNAVRSWMNAIVGRPGWTLGTIREIAGGTGDLATNLYDLSRGKPTQLSHRSAYVIALLLGGAIMNGILNVLLTGTAPKGMDFVAPRDGGITDDGHESRIIIPLYLSKDVYSWATHPLRTLKAKMAQPLMVTSDLATNRDFQNHKIYGHGGIGIDTYLMQIFFPYVLTGAIKNIERGQGWKTALPFVGIMPGSRDVGLSKAEMILQTYREEQMASVRPAPTDHTRARSKIMMAAERGDVDAVRDLGMEGIDKQTLSKRDVDAAMKRIDTPLIVSEIKAVTDMETLMEAYDAATPEERDQIENTVRAKVAKGRHEPYKWTPRARKLAEKYFDIEIPVPGGPADDLGKPADLEGTA